VPRPPLILEQGAIAPVEEGVVLEEEGPPETVPLQQSQLPLHGLVEIDLGPGLDSPDKVHDVDDERFLRHDSPQYSMFLH